MSFLKMINNFINISNAFSTIYSPLIRSSIKNDFKVLFSNSGASELWLTCFRIVEFKQNGTSYAKYNPCKLVGWSEDILPSLKNLK